MKPNSLPFKNSSKPETIEVSDPVLGSLELPKRYGVSFNEEIEVTRVLSGGDGEAVRMPAIHLGLATIALRRIEPGWTEDQTKALPVQLIRACSEYLLNERNQWITPDPVTVGKSQTGTSTKSKSGKATDNSTGDSPTPSPKTSDGTETTSETNS